MSWRLLCICDSPAALLLYQSILELAGFRVLAAPSLKHGLRASDGIPLDCVVLDLRAEAGRLVRKIRLRRPGVPVLFVWLRTETWAQLYSQVDMFITQDEAIEELPQRVEELLHRRESETDNSRSRGTVLKRS
jgi:DNA-binding response OmpR family regulator